MADTSQGKRSGSVLGPGQPLRGIILGLAIVAGIGVIDLFTGPDFGFTLFYLVPIVMVAWAYGAWPGVVVAVGSAAIQFFAEAVLRPDQQLVAVAFNAITRLAIYIGGAVIADRVRHDRERMSAIDAQRDEFLRVLEHELTVPAQEMVESLNAAQARYSLDARDIDAIRQRAESLLFLTHDFVALGQAEARRLQLRSAPIDIAHLVTEISRQRPDHRSVLVTVPSEGLIAVGDPDRLRQAIANVVSEVIRDAGELDYVSINVRERDGQPVVTISAALPVASAAAAEREQPRVGLRLARLLVEAMGGTMTVERAVLGRGTRVTLRLPGQARPPAAALAPAPSTRRR
jgi:signal transduction histidine kinase